ncbi:MAG: hypothetical protein MZV64_56290 [Ignavibacteriales bacterium]|nr:hypothetical protein [Ignavibacteriales bacterium]
MKNILFVSAFVLIAAISVFAQASDTTVGFDPSRNPFDDLKVAVDSAVGIKQKNNS